MYYPNLKLIKHVNHSWTSRAFIILLRVSIKYVIQNEGEKKAELAEKTEQAEQAK